MAHHGGTVDLGGEGGAEAPYHAHGGEFCDSSGGEAQARSTRDRAGRGKCGGEGSREGEALSPQPQQLNLNKECGFQHAHGPYVG